MVFGVGLGLGAPPPPGWSDTYSSTSFYKYFPDDPADTPEKAIGLVLSFTAEGINHFSLRFHWQTPREFMDRLEWFAENVMPAFREA
jgi:hypothetical protein